MRQTTNSLFHLIARQAVNSTAAPADAKPQCGGGGLASDAAFNMGLHIGALFIILFTSAVGMSFGVMSLTIGSTFPILSKRVPALRIPNSVFLVAKFFGTGVIIATAFIHVHLSARPLI
jgi:hypothetical protein